MEILAAFDLMGSSRAAADVAGVPITPSPGWSPNATPGARDSLSGPVRRLDRRRVSRGVVTGSHLDRVVQGQSSGPPWATVRVLGWRRRRSHGPGAATGRPGQFREWTVGAIHVGWSRSRPFLGLRKPPGPVIGKRLAWRRRLDGLADGMDVGGYRNTWRSGIPDGRSGRVVR